MDSLMQEFTLEATERRDRIQQAVKVYGGEWADLGHCPICHRVMRVHVTELEAYSRRTREAFDVLYAPLGPGERGRVVPVQHPCGCVENYRYDRGERSA